MSPQQQATQFTQYIVESCGSTLEITTKKDVAIEVYSNAVGPVVSILGQDSLGKLHTLYTRTRK